jgi:hypothetical protein
MAVSIPLDLGERIRKYEPRAEAMPIAVVEINVIRSDELLECPPVSNPPGISQFEKLVVVEKPVLVEIAVTPLALIIGEISVADAGIAISFEHGVIAWVNSAQLSLLMQEVSSQI